MLYECCVFHAFVELLNIEIENNTAANNARKKISVSLSDSTDLRVILSVLYIVVEVMRIINENDSERDRQLKENFKADLETEFKDELLHIKLLGMFITCQKVISKILFNINLFYIFCAFLVYRYGHKTLFWFKSSFPNEKSFTAFVESNFSVSGRNGHTQAT